MATEHTKLILFNTTKSINVYTQICSCKLHLSRTRILTHQLPLCDSFRKRKKGLSTPDVPPSLHNTRHPKIPVKHSQNKFN